MEWFKPDGHLTDLALQLLVDGEPTELERLEASEHLGFCDACMHRYLALLADERLLAPAQPMQKPVLKRLRAKTARRGWGRYGTVAAAACMALVMWGVGTFVYGRTVDAPQQMAGQAQGNISLGQRISGFFANLLGGDGQADVLDGQSPPPESQPPPQLEPQTTQTAPPPLVLAPPPAPQSPAPAPAAPTRQERESVFEQTDKDRTQNRNEPRQDTA